MKKNRTYLVSIAVIVLSFIITVSCILTGNYTPEWLDAQVGNVSPMKVVAPRQIENTYATEKKRQEAASTVTPLIRIDNSVTETVNSNIAHFFEGLDERMALENAEDEEDISLPAENAEILPSPVIVSDEQFKVYSAQSRATRTEFKDALIEIADSVLENGIKDETDTKSLLYIRDELNRKQWPAEMINMGYSVITTMLEPNLVEDKEATQAAMEAKIGQVQPVMVLEGQKIVDEGEIITEEIYSLLAAFDMVADDSERSSLTVTGIITLTALAFFVFIFYMKTYFKSVSSSLKKVLLLGFLFCFAMVLVRSMANITFYIIPITIPCILIAILIDERLSVFLNCLIAILAALIYKGGADFILFFTLSGSFAILSSKYTFDRTKIIIVGTVLCFFNLLLLTAMNLFFHKSLEPELMFYGLIAVANGLLSLLIAIGSLPIWEAAFDIITPVKLLDLTSPNNTLLRRLTIEAPGTYHHSLIVANLAERAAYDLGANAPLARVGGYYHDIGKLKYPYYFGENQAASGSAHDDLDPYDSAQLIMQHVPIGVELADHHKLPKVIKDIIAQHHGTTLVKFFYHKAKEMYSEAQIKEEDFRYKCIIPKSRESAVVMLADTAEAAVRSMISSSKSMDEVDEFLRVLIKDKLDDAQLDDSFLTISDLVTIRESFMKVFRGMYHERVKYPTPSTDHLAEEAMKRR